MRLTSHLFHTSLLHAPKKVIMHNNDMFINVMTRTKTKTPPPPPSYKRSQRSRGNWFRVYLSIYPLLNSLFSNFVGIYE